MRSVLLLGVAAVVVAIVLVAGTRRQEPAATARFLRWAGFGLVVGIAGFFGLFAVGETFMDPGGWRAVALVAAWVLPLAACCAIAWWRPDPAARLLSVVTVLVLAWDVWLAIDPETWRRIEDQNGPVHAVTVLALAAALALLGLQRARAAGVLLVLTGLGNLLALSRPAGAAVLLGVVSAVPVLSGVLFLAAAAVGSRAGDTATHQSL